MARSRIVHRCTDCGSASPQWTGRCPGCGEWNTLVEEVDRTTATTGSGAGPKSAAAPAAVVSLADIGGEDGDLVPTGVAELDRVLGGGLVPGSVTLLGGEPGIGKSTLLLQALAQMAGQGCRGLLVSAEESPAQVRRRADRLQALMPGLWLVAETSMPAILAAVEQTQPDVLVVDSIQTVWDPEIDSTPGSTVQVRGCAHHLVALAKSGGPTTALVGHVTKEGTLAGPRLLEHVVDTVLSFEGDRHHALRLLRATKHRFGPTGELGLFEMTEAGLVGLADPGGLFLADRQPGIPGSVVFPALEGQRPLLVEIQALAVETSMGSPRRSATGIDAGRLALLLAVLERRAGFSFAHRDVYVSAVGGVRVTDPGADLAICLAVASAVTERSLSDDTVVLGEVGLGGEVRQVSQTPRRLAEAARLGFGRAVVPERAPAGPLLSLRRTSSVSDAVERFLRHQPIRPGLRVVPTTS